MFAIVFVWNLEHFIITIINFWKNSFQTLSNVETIRFCIRMILKILAFLFRFSSKTTFFLLCVHLGQYPFCLITLLVIKNEYIKILGQYCFHLCTVSIYIYYEFSTEIYIVAESRVPPCEASFAGVPFQHWGRPVYSFQPRPCACHSPLSGAPWWASTW